ncbi:hypothetical protein EUA93_13015 [Nocardioides oleivorans]|uniref:HEAT repeat domain-containing protein n=1 Tax=Nocardioides oleivorans TaxID=273676 RepID=A0A4Q2S4M6_9ACTN|nr:hypothetical protein [Nocardioides oleivorans]RYB95183.1 hypothetical protein EUA93_13015 [Nocardioides oleivorans]
MTTAARLLQQIDRLSYPERQRVLAGTARRLAGTAELPVLLDELMTQDAFGRRLALQIAVVAGDAACVARCLDAPEPSVRARAIAAFVALDLAPDALLARVPDLPAAHRTVLYRALRRRPPAELGERVLALVLERFGDREAAALLPALDHDRVAALLPGLDHAVASWAALGRRHPDVVLAYVEERLDAEPVALWARTWAQVGPAVAAAVPADPGRVLGLLERSLPHTGLPHALLGRTGALARSDAARFVRLVADPRHRGRPPLRRRTLRALAGVGTDDLVVLGRTLEPDGRLPDLLRALPPSERVAVHRGVVGERGPEPSRLWQALAAIDLLPVRARHEEASRLLAFPSVADDPDQRLEVTARLAWSEARDTLLEATRRPDADARAMAWTAATRAAAGSRDAATWSDFIGGLDRFRNDQDPVRYAVLAGLASAPPWLFTDRDAPVVTRLVRDAAEARDCSWGTRSAIRALCDRLLREGAVAGKRDLLQAALDGLRLLAAHGAAVDLHGIGRDLPRGAERAVLASLAPRIEADAARGDFGVALALAQGLGRRAWDLPQLQAYVDRARGAKDDAIVRRAVSLWLDPPPTRDERVAAVLRGDRSTITFHEVARVVGWRRTDLLDDVLRRSMHGRFLERGVRFVPAFDGCSDRWLPRQVAAQTKLLTSIATSGRLPAWERASAVRSLAGSGADATVLLSLADDAEVAVAEAAVAGLSRSDDPAAVLPHLLALAATDRARVAVPAITRAIRLVAPDAALAAARSLLEGSKVTSRKEAVRLLAEHRVPGAAPLLLEVWSAPDQHRDVRRAVAAAARLHLDDPAAWEVLERAAVTPEVATALLHLPVGTVAGRHREPYAALVHLVAGADDPDTARLGLRALAAWLPWRPDAVNDLVATVADLTRTALWRAASTALVEGSALIGSADPLVRTARSLVTVDDGSLDGPSRDRPARQRLSELVGATCAAAARHPDRRRRAGALGQALEQARPDAALVLHAAALDQPGVADLERICVLADRPLLAHAAQRAVADSLAGAPDRLPPGTAAPLLDDLRPHDGLARGLVAVAIAAAAGATEGWSEAVRAHVQALRAHPDPDVRLAALDVAMAPE